jgi:hypothetical protein
MVILQVGHYNRTTGSTGAPGEKDFNWDVCNKVAELLRPYKEVRVVRADPPTVEITGDYELFLAIHYDADIYGKGGYLVDFPEPRTDGNTKESQRIAGVINEVYGRETGIVCHPERSNDNTRFYYMWQKISPKTPCVLIECGVGQHHPDDYEILFNQREKVVSGILKGILKAFNIEEESMTEEQKKVLAIIESYRVEANHGNLEGAVNAAVGAARDLPIKNEQILSLENKIKDLELKIADINKILNELKQNYVLKEKEEAKLQKEITTANGKIDELILKVEEVDRLAKDNWNLYDDKRKEFLKYKETTEKELKQKVINSMTVRELFNLIVKKLTVKK